MDHEDADARLLAELAGTANGQVAEDDAARAIAEQATTLLPAAAHASITPSIEPITSSGDSGSIAMRSGMMIGAENGSQLITFASVLFGSIMIGWMKMKLTMMSIITGVAACCASCSLFTIAPTAANSDE